MSRWEPVMCEHGKRIDCPPCLAEHHRQQTAAYRKKHKDRIQAGSRAARFKYKYGITLEDYDQMVAEQDGRCAICGEPPTDRRNVLHVDHCHDGGHVRGLLCTSCNVMLGMAADRPHVLEAGAAYLRRTEAPTYQEIA